MTSSHIITPPAQDRSPLPGDRLMDVGEVAAYLGIPAQTLYSWRVNHRGPRGIRIGRHLRYRWTDVDQWLESQADDQALNS